MKTICVVCEKNYNPNESTATGGPDNQYLYCSDSCEAIDTAWLEEGIKIVESAKANDPAIFNRSSLNQEQEQALKTIQQLNKSSVQELQSMVDRVEPFIVKRTRL